MSTCAAYYAAAARCEELSGLADAELRRRGLLRETLARDVCACLDRADARRKRNQHIRKGVGSNASTFNSTGGSP
jgi:hypothetical protein